MANVRYNRRSGVSSVGKTKNFVDMSYMITVLIMLAFGLIMVFSASTPVSIRFFGHSWHFFRLQAIWIGIGLVAMVIVMNIDYKTLGRFAKLGLYITIILHIIILIPGVGIR